jgi:hypothetical protein
MGKICHNQIGTLVGRARVQDLRLLIKEFYSRLFVVETLESEEFIATECQRN